MKTKQICVMDVVATKLFAAALALFLIFAFSTCDNDSTRKKPGTKKTYSIGDTGPGGGTIFYYDEKGFKMTDTGKKAYYLEAAPSGEGYLKWLSNSSFYETEVVGISTAIGTGRNNTTLILNILGENNAPAAKACKDAAYNGKTDWFLPSKDELNKLYENLRELLEDGSVEYWTSSQCLYTGGGSGEFRAWTQRFSDGRPSQAVTVYDMYKVYAIRAF